MQINDPEPIKVIVHDYTFTFPNGRTLGISLWPHAGDTISEVEGVRLSFHFPRLKEVKTVYLGPGVVMESKESVREFVTDEEMQKRFKKALELKAMEQKEKREKVSTR